MLEKRKMSVYLKMLNKAIVNYAIDFQYDFHSTIYLFVIVVEHFQKFF